MHEASIVRELLRSIQRLAPGRRVLEVHVSVGLLSGVSPDAMRFYFEALRDETLGRQAELRARLEPLRARCRSCDKTSVLEEALWQCPDCGRGSLAFENGDELDLTHVVVADDDDHDRTEDPREERRHRRGEPAGA